jgi:hypothetical protein
MRSAYLVLIAAGCGFRSAGSEVVPDGGVSGMHMFTAAELGAGARVDMTVDGVRGSLTPNAYSYGGLTVHGLKGQRLWMHSDTDWNKLSTVTSTGAGLWCGERLGNKVAGTQPDVDYLGVPEDATMTLWFEGEVWLDGRPGAMLHPSGDDLAFVDIAPPKSTVYMRLAENAQVAVPASVMASGAGWYPIRVGFGNGDGTFDFSFTHSDAGGPEIAWTRDRMRARTSELGGVLRTVYGQEILGGGLALPGGQVAPPVPHFEQDDLLAPSDFSNSQLGPPQGAPADDAHWSARYAGQVYIATPGMYTLQTETDDGNRARLGVDGHDADAFALNHGVGANQAMTMAKAALPAGWNDLTVDLNQASGGANIHVRIQGPDFPSLVEIPRDRLRPVEPADDRLALGADDTADNIPDNGGQNNDGTATMTVVGFTGTGGAAGAAGAAEVVDSIELVYEINSPHWDQLRVDLEAPATGAGPGARVTIRDKKPGPGGDGDRSEELSLPANAPAPLSALRAAPGSCTCSTTIPAAPATRARCSARGWCCTPGPAPTRSRALRRGPRR